MIFSDYETLLRKKSAMYVGVWLVDKSLAHLILYEFCQYDVHEKTLKMETK